MLPERLRGLRAGAEEALGHARRLARVALGSGVLWEVRPQGVLEALRVLATTHAQNMSHLYRVHGRNQPAKVALLHRGAGAQGEAYTYGRLDELMGRVAAGLRRRGLPRDAALLVLCRNRPEHLLATGGGARLGVRVIPGSYRSAPREIAHIVRHGGVGAVVFDAELSDAVEEGLAGAAVPPALRFVVQGRGGGAAPFEALLEEAPLEPSAEGGEGGALVMYTSGTTGSPKGAVRRFSRSQVMPWLEFLGATPLRADDVHLAVCPLYHATGMAFVAMTHRLGGSVVLEESFTPESFVDAVTRHKVTTTALVPTMLGRLVGLAPERLASMPRTLRAVFVGGAPLSPRLALDAMDALGDVLFQFYGATETGLVTLATPTDLRERPASIGRALPGVEVRLLDEAGAPVALGDVGELFAASASLIEGYAGDPNATAASLREGAFSVGDLAYADDEGRYFLVGRKRDLIISGGVNVYPAEVEAVLEAHPDVAEAAVVGAPDADLGERVVAFVVLREGVTPGNDHLEAHARRELAGPKRPRAYHWVTELPRNPTGKVLKTELRRRVQGAPGAT